MHSLSHSVNPAGQELLAPLPPPPLLAPLAPPPAVPLLASLLRVVVPSPPPVAAEPLVLAASAELLEPAESVASLADDASVLPPQAQSQTHNARCPDLITERRTTGMTRMHVPHNPGLLAVCETARQRQLMGPDLASSSAQGERAHWHQATRHGAGILCGAGSTGPTAADGVCQRVPSQVHGSVP